MKSIKVAFGVILAALSLVASAEVDTRARGIIDSIRLGKDNLDQIVTLRVQEGVVLPASSIESADIASGAITGAKLASATVSQYDTNATTTVTAYTASSIGQLLIGRTASSGRVWRASATGTNSWVQVLTLP